MRKVEQALLDILKENKGEAYQSELVTRSGFSRSRVSEVLSELEKNGTLSRFPLGIGKNYNVVLHTSLNRSNRTKAGKTIRLGFTRAAEYPFIIPFKKLLKDRLDLDLDLRIYKNGIDVTRDLSHFRLDLGISPILTQFMFYTLGSPIRIIAPAGSGGSSLIVSKAGRNSRMGRLSKGTEFRIASTKISTMELLMRSSINKDVVPKKSGVVYTSSPEEMMKDAASHLVDAVCMWEPYATILLTKKKDDFTRLIRYRDMGEHLCCGLAAESNLDESLVERVRRVFLESLEKYTASSDSFIGPYAALTGFSQKLIGRVGSEYSYQQELDSDMISRQFYRAGLTVPTPFSVRDAFNFSLPSEPV